VLPAIPQIEEDLLFGREDLRTGCASGTYEDIGVGEAREAVSMGRIVPSAFVVLQGRSEEDGTVCDKFLSAEPVLAERSVKMETLSGFSLNLVRNNHLMSWDVKSGYRHFYVHPKMLNYFLFHYDGRSCKCIALPFDWGRSILWFTKLMRPVVKRIRSELGYRVLP
jgi:hypothetical protein